MTHLTLTGIINTGQMITSDHFGGNVVFRRNTTDGEPDSEMQTALNELDITVTRYPAGETDIAFLSGILEDGGLPQHLTTYLDWARENGLAVVIVTPTHAAYDGPEDFAKFAELLATEYSDVVHAFEIGNEYWGHQTETSYGQVANDSVIAINEGLMRTSVDIPIWVQMGDAGGFMSEFHPANDDRGWITRNTDANLQILDQLSQEARDIIDGTVEHYYFRETEQALGDLIHDQLIQLDSAIWQSALGDEVTLNITEWNIRTTNYEQLGMRAGSSMLAQFSYMMEMGVDSASVWAPMHNTSSDLAGADDVYLDPDTGVVANSVGGAVFDLMSTSLVGLEYLRGYGVEGSAVINHHMYASNEQVVVYISSRSEERETVSYSLGDFFNGAQLSRATLVGYDTESSDGRYFHYQEGRFVDAEYVVINGVNYYLNEHDVRASVQSLDLDIQSDTGEYVFELMPYEVVEIVFTLPNLVYVYGTSGVDRHTDPEGSNESVASFGGNDVIRTGGGYDTVSAGAGDDYVDTGSEADAAYGGTGNDTIRSWGGDDSLFGGEGHDNLYGWAGNDHLSGGLGDDYLEGGAGDDTVLADGGLDTVVAGAGNDHVQILIGDELEFSIIAQSLRGILGQEVELNYSVDTVQNNRTSVDGGPGIDTVSLSDSADLFVFYNSEANDGPMAMLDLFSIEQSGVEVLNAGQGDDIIVLRRSDSNFPVSVNAGDGDDLIIASNLGDRVDSGAGDDTIFVDGFSEIIGGAGADTFILNNAEDFSYIVDFSRDEGDTVISEIERPPVSRTRLKESLFLNDLGSNVDNELECAVSCTDPSSFIMHSHEEWVL